MARRAAADAAPHLGFHLLAPARRSGALPMELEALLPNRRHNDELMVQLQLTPGEAGAQGSAIAAVFAADPFIPKLRSRLSPLYAPRSNVEALGVITLPSATTGPVTTALTSIWSP